MESRQALAVCLLVAVASVAIVAPVVGATATTSLQAENATGGNETGGNDTQFGDQMTVFMQSSAAEANGSVEAGMWEAAFEHANESERARLAHQRAAQLDGRMRGLAERNESLWAAYRNGTINRSEFVRGASQLGGQMAALESSVNGTARAAERAGLNVTALETLRQNASALSGPQVAGIARGLIDGDRGPPEGVPGRGPPGATGTERPGGGPPGTQAGPPRGTVSTGAPNGTPGNPGGNPGGGPGDGPGGGPNSLLDEATLFIR